MRKLGIFLVILIVVVGTAVFAWQLKPKGVVSGELSERSREFLADQAGTQESEWRRVEFEGGDVADTRNSVFDVDGCFSFMMIYRIFNERSDGACQGYYAFNNPKGTIVTYIREASNISSVDGADGVSFRRLTPEKYQENTKTVGGREFLIFKNLEEPYEATAYHYYPGYFLVFNLKAVTGENLDSDLEKMLGSIEIHKTKKLE